MRPETKRLRWLPTGLARVAALVLLAALSGAGATAATSGVETSEALTARLVTAENSVAPGTASISAGLHLDLEKGWKTYWRSPGEVGFPPRIDWSGSENVRETEFLWPAPTRFRAFGIENFGYADEVVFPVRIRLDEAGARTRLEASVSLLACSTICVPQDFTLSLELPAGSGGIDTKAASLIAAYADRVPGDGTSAGLSPGTAALDADGDALTVTVESASAMTDPDVFAEMGPATAFGPPDIRLGPDARRLWAKLPILSPDPPEGPLRLTITDGDRAATFDTVPLAAEPPPPPYAEERSAAPAGQLVWIALVAMLGGLILNAMPCVLPVLSIKLASAVKARDRDAASVRTGFLFSALGVLAFMWLLAGATLALRGAGVSVGWGLQFQNPVFLTVMIGILAVFAANLAGLFEITLPSSWNTAMAEAEVRRGHLGDFATGAFAAVLATPCSAPFLGTAVTFALAGGARDIVVIFTALGVGLALPYLLVAARPALVRALPRPGRWMLMLKWALGGLLGLTAAWLFWVLAGVAGQAVTAAVAVAIAALIGVLSQGARIPAALRATAVAGLVAVGVAAPLLIAPPPAAAPSPAGDVTWVPFERSAIARQVSRGEVVFVDVTADWCLTCKANKAMVLDRDPVASALASDEVSAMRADWTRPDERISRFLAEHDRYAIPFNVVYGPAAPEGILLPELLGTAAVMEALDKAAGRDIATGG